MRRMGVTIVAAVLLAGCNDDPAPLPRGANPTEPSGDYLAEVKQAEPVPAGPERRILAFGDSLFAGYRLGRGQGYPERLQAALRERGINARVTNAGVSGDTTAAGRQRFNFVLGSLAGPPDLAIVELGGNDLLRAVPPSETRANLDAILAGLHKRKIPILLMGMRAPPNMGPAYVAEFNALYPDLARTYGAHLVPFFLASIYDKPHLRQQDYVHPTAAGVDALVAATVDDVAAALPKVG
jgi:acyl-CoA thioesterase-1